MWWVRCKNSLTEVCRSTEEAAINSFSESQESVQGGDHLYRVLKVCNPGEAGQRRGNNAAYLRTLERRGSCPLFQAAGVRMGIWREAWGGCQTALGGVSCLSRWDIWVLFWQYGESLENYYKGRSIIKWTILKHRPSCREETGLSGL